MTRFKIPAVIILLSILTLSFTVRLATQPEQYLTKGNSVNYTLTAENGAISYSEVKIKDVTTVNGTTSIYAHDNRLNDQRKSTFQYRMNFYSDSLNWCVDALNHLNVPVVYSSNYILEFVSDSLVYPYAMKVGDTLLSASATETKMYSSNMRMVRFTGRKVTAQETIGVGGMQLQAFRIECKMISSSITDYGALGKIPTEATYDFTEWFVPSKGVVKSELKSKTGTTTTILQ